jgi:hypothetical protein
MTPTRRTTKNREKRSETDGEIGAQVKVYERSGIKPILWPHLAGSWPRYVFTSAPLKQPAGHFGLGHGLGAHAPDEYFLI